MSYLTKQYFPSFAWLNDPELGCKRGGAPGLQRAWFSVRSQFGHWLLSQTTDHQFATITGQTGTNDVWYELPILRGSSTLTEEQSFDGGLNYVAELSLVVPLWDATSRDAVNRLVSYRDTILIVLDQNGTYWMVGETTGCQVTSSATTGQAGATQGTTLTATARQNWPLRTVSTDYLNGVIIPPLTKRLCQYAINDLCSLPFSELCNISF